MLRGNGRVGVLMNFDNRIGQSQKTPPTVL